MGLLWSLLADESAEGSMPRTMDLSWSIYCKSNMVACGGLLDLFSNFVPELKMMKSQISYSQ